MIRQHNPLLTCTVLVALALLAVGSDAFALITLKAVATSTRTITPLHMLPDYLSFSSLPAQLLISADDAELEAAAMAAALGPLRTFFGGIAALILLAGGLIFATGTFLVPAATEQLEKDTKRLRPGLWEEYEAKLKEGEDMASRPDLLQELGDIMAPILRTDFDASAAKIDNEKKGSTGGDEAGGEETDK